MNIQQKRQFNTIDFLNHRKFHKELYETSEILKALSYVRRHLKSYFNNGESWRNEYVSINSPYQDEIQSLKSDDDFIIKYYHIGGYLYYKILPKEAIKETCPFLQKNKCFDKCFDGCLTYDCFIDNDTESNIILNDIDNLYVAVLFRIYNNHDTYLVTN
jgi:hypothetical protein